LLAAIVVASALPACSEERDDGTKPTGEASLPSIELKDDTPNLLLTWVDDRGRTHTGTKPSEIPEEGKEKVRVITEEAGHGSLFYVADLRAKGPDGTYPVRTMKRSEWEAMIAKRRHAYQAKHAPPPPPGPAPGEAPADPHHATPPAGALTAVIYGASWCGPCHAAAKYLKKRGVKVVEHDIEEQPRYAKEMHRKLRSVGMSGGSIPVIDVGGVILRGYNPRALDRAIAEAQKRGTRL
jgi:glutaredoxin